MVYRVQPYWLAECSTKKAEFAIGFVSKPGNCPDIQRFTIIFPIQHLPFRLLFGPASPNDTESSTDFCCSACSCPCGRVAEMVTVVGDNCRWVVDGGMFSPENNWYFFISDISTQSDHVRSIFVLVLFKDRCQRVECLQNVATIVQKVFCSPKKQLVDVGCYPYPTSHKFTRPLPPTPIPSNFAMVFKQATDHWSRIEVSKFGDSISWLIINSDLN